MTKHKKSRSEKREARLLQEQLEAQAIATGSPVPPKPVAPPPPPPKPKVKKDARPKAPGKIMQLVTFFREARRELNWVTWATRKETVKSTGVILVLVGISAAYLGMVDGILSRVLGLIMR
ncbi:MAG: preprotein translocase subunit SecE [Deltaproteobacteria bacterium]|jgi:preprotein translocase subunit SecE|nr:preprotein translocase subunit SecE [Deltaproteobacteria bacterium]